MNTPSPLIPQGTTPAKGKVSIFVKVLIILTVHVVVIGGCLLAGCSDTKDKAPVDTSATTPDTSAQQPAVSSNAISNAAGPVAGAPAGNPAGQPVVPTPGPGPIPMQPQGQAPVQAQQPIGQQPPAIQPPPVAPQVAPSGEAKEYLIASGDTLGALAKKNGVSLKALLEANPNVNPKKLQVGQKIQIPAGSATASTSTSISGIPAPEAAGADSSVYVVKTGDTLGKIAKQNHTTYKKIMAMNDLKTTAIKIGQKLKMPTPRASEAPVVPTVPTPAPVAPVAPTVAPVAPVATPSTTGSNQ